MEAYVRKLSKEIEGDLKENTIELFYKVKNAIRLYGHSLEHVKEKYAAASGLDKSTYTLIEDDAVKGTFKTKISPIKNNQKLRVKISFKGTSSRGKQLVDIICAELVRNRTDNLKNED